MCTHALPVALSPCLTVPKASALRPTEPSQHNAVYAGLLLTVIKAAFRRGEERKCFQGWPLTDLGASHPKNRPRP